MIVNFPADMVHEVELSALRTHFWERRPLAIIRMDILHEERRFHKMLDIFFLNLAAWRCHNALVITFSHLYRVFIKYCVFFRILKNILDSVFPRWQCVYTYQAGRTPALRQNWQSSEKSQNLKEKTQFLMNTLYVFFSHIFRNVAFCKYFLASSACIGHGFACFLMTKKTKHVNIHIYTKNINIYLQQLSCNQMLL